ncbi:DNA-directed RNA polymerase III subunit RPC4-like isoform X1 [Haemaphysalis longicornis]
MSGTPNGTPSKANSSPQLPRGILGRSGTPLLPGARLPSLRGPRDLTLSGGTPGVKRTFTPNVAATRRAPVQKEEDGSGKGRGWDAVRGSHHQGGGRGRQWNRGDGKGRNSSDRGRPSGRGDRISDRFIQTQGATFAQGVEGEAKATSAAAFPKWNNRSESVHVEKPKLPSIPCSASLTSEEKAEDQKKLELLLRSDFIDDGSGEIPRLFPTTLPLLVPSGSASELKPLVKPEIPVKSEVPVVKQEPTEEPVLAKAVPSTALKRTSLADLCTDPNLPEIGQLLFFQLPDSLPGLDTPSEQPEKEAPNLQAPSLVKMEQPETFSGQVKLRHFPEGYVGKLQVLKSGRVRLLLGAVALTVNMGTRTSFRQDLISFRLSESGGADASVLGQVQYKLICLPDVEQLLAANPGVS